MSGPLGPLLEPEGRGLAPERVYPFTIAASGEKKLPIIWDSMSTKEQQNTKPLPAYWGNTGADKKQAKTD